MRSRRRPTQHWRRYRSGKYTFINRGVRYMKQLTMADSKNEFSAVEWNYLIDKFNTVPSNISLNEARKKIKVYRDNKELLDLLSRELFNAEYEYKDMLFKLGRTKEKLEVKKDNLKKAYRAYNTIRYGLGYSKYTSPLPDIQAVYDELGGM